MNGRKISGVTVIEYHYWHLSGASEAARSHLAAEISRAASKLYDVLRQPAAPAPSPAASDFGLVERSWLDTAIKTADEAGFGLVKARAVGESVLLIIGAEVRPEDAPKVLAAFAAQRFAPEDGPAMYLGALEFVGLGVEGGGGGYEELEATGKAFAKDHDIDIESDWALWTHRRGESSVAFATGKGGLPASNRIFAISSDEPAALRFALEICPLAGRYATRTSALGQGYVDGLAPALLEHEAKLSRFKEVPDDLDRLSRDNKALASETAAFAEDQADLSRLAQNIETDKQNFDTLLTQERIEPVGWFGRMAIELRDMARQTASDAAHFQVSWNRANAILNAIDTKAELIRAEQETLQSERATKLTVRLTVLGIIIGLANIIDREHSREFIQWFNGFGVIELAQDGLPLFVSRLALITVASIIALGAYRLIWPSDEGSAKPSSGANIENRKG
ncbi:MAG: hypothetical protein MRY74_08295 [Neomegalonema sp.]|nr:hypothetical protein [Neomegalonema sp.]